MKQADPDTIQWLAQADLLLWAARWLQRPTEHEATLALSHDERCDLLDAAGLGHDASLHEAIDALEHRRARTPGDVWMDEYHRLFETGGVCAIEQAAYVRRDKGAILGDLCGFYQAFGFTPDGIQGDRPDHLACELEFTALLLVMLAQARTQAADEAEQVTHRALASFASDHLDEWIDAFCDRLELISVLDLYKHVAWTMRSLWNALITGHDWPRAPRDAVREPRIDEPVGSPYECGMAESAPAVELRVNNQPSPTPSA